MLWHMYVCTYVCMFVCMYVCMCLCMKVCMCVCVCKHVWRYVCMYILYLISFCTGHSSRNSQEDATLRLRVAASCDPGRTQVCLDSKSDRSDEARHWGKRARSFDRYDCQRSPAGAYLFQILLKNKLECLAFFKVLSFVYYWDKCSSLSLKY